MRLSFWINPKYSNDFMNPFSYFQGMMYLSLQTYSPTFLMFNQVHCNAFYYLPKPNTYPHWFLSFIWPHFLWTCLGLVRYFLQPLLIFSFVPSVILNYVFDAYVPFIDMCTNHKSFILYWFWQCPRFKPLPAQTKMYRRDILLHV